jgi:hypothetical protein
MTEQMTDEQKKFCNQVAQWMERIREFPGGTTFLVDLFVSICATQSLDIVDRSDPSISLRREITQELYDRLGRSLRSARSAGTAAISRGRDEQRASQCRAFRHFAFASSQRGQLRK